MAEQTFNVKSGFFNAENGDRVYSADDMNKPYKRVVSDGVFATQYGTPSTDFQVIAGTGLQVKVKSGNAIVAAKWLESSADIPVSVPSNTALTTRTDGVFIQVDNSTRTGNIVYKSGDITPDTNGKTEYLVAKVTVASGATAISQANIEDMRGTSSCPWVTGIIKQVDTSALFDQYRQAFADMFSAYQQQINQNINTAQAEWAAALEDLSDELTVSTNIITQTSFHTATGDETTIPINISGFDNTTDLLCVYINGLCAPTSFYSVSGQNIELTNAIHAGDTVLFVCFKALINGSISSAVVLMEDLQNDVSQLMNDTGWVTITLSSGTAGTVTPRYRSIGGRVTLSGVVTASGVFGTLPDAVRPDQPCSFVVPDQGGYAVLTIAANGELSVTGTDAAIDCTFLSASVVGSTSILPNADNMQF